MKTVAILIAAIFAGSSLAATDKGQNFGDQGKTIEITIGGAFPTGDVKDDLDGNTGLIFGVDHYLRQAGMNSKTFFGLRGYWVGADTDMSAIGGHIGIRFDWSQGNSGMGGGQFYGKAAAGYYRSAFDLGTADISEAGFGGFVSVGYEFGGSQATPWALEFGYYFLPEVSPVNNNGWFGAASFRF